MAAASRLELVERRGAVADAVAQLAVSRWKRSTSVPRNGCVGATLLDTSVVARAVRTWLWEEFRKVEDDLSSNGQECGLLLVLYTSCWVVE